MPHHRVSVRLCSTRAPSVSGDPDRAQVVAALVVGDDVIGAARDHDADAPPQAVLVVRAHLAVVRAHQRDRAARDHVADHAVAGAAGERDRLDVAVAHDEPVSAAAGHAGRRDHHVAGRRAGDRDPFERRVVAREAARPTAPPASITTRRVASDAAARSVTPAGTTSGNRSPIALV